MAYAPAAPVIERRSLRRGSFGHMDDPAHLRTIARLSSDYIVSALAELTRQAERDPLDIFIFLGVMSANSAHLHDRQMADEAQLEKRPITTLALASSLGLPRETCRRRLAALEEAGMIERTRRGVLAITEGYTPDQAETFGRSNVMLLRRLVTRLRQQGVSI